MKIPSLRNVLKETVILSQLWTTCNNCGYFLIRLTQPKITIFLMLNLLGIKWTVVDSNTLILHCILILKCMKFLCSPAPKLSLRLSERACNRFRILQSESLERGSSLKMGQNQVTRIYMPVLAPSYHNLRIHLKSGRLHRQIYDPMADASNAVRWTGIWRN